MSSRRLKVVSTPKNTVYSNSFRSRRDKTKEQRREKETEQKKRQNKGETENETEERGGVGRLEERDVQRRDEKGYNGNKRLLQKGDHFMYHGM